MKKILFGLMACAALCACTSDDLISVSGETQKVFDGEKAYLVVNINDVGSSTRATSPENPFEYGTNEQAVSTAHFYFYDDSGEFVTEATVWDGGTASTADPAANVEFTGNTVVVLDHLTEVGYPKYMVTILNKPADFVPANELSTLERQLADENDLGIYNAAGNFVMSTTSFGGQVDQYSQTLPYFVTEVKDENFSLEPVDLQSTTLNPVEVYVERLAVKVTLAMGIEPDQTTGMYPIETTIAGDPNSDTTGDDVGAEILYVKINGWTLNATTRHSNMMKNIYEPWEDEDFNFTWNDADNHRSYWGMSWNYNMIDDPYPDWSNGQLSSAEGSEGTWLNKYVRYYSYNDASTALGSSLYCPENTNTAGSEPMVMSTVPNNNYVLTNKYSSAITGIIVSATICDAEGNALDLVRYNGVLFEEDQFLAYALNVLNVNGYLNYYTMTEMAEGDVYTQVGADDVVLVDLGGGYVGLTLTDAAAAQTYYALTGYDWSTGEPVPVYTEIENGAYILNGVLDEYFGLYAYINGYEGGDMFYYIPIEHLNNEYGNVLQEANYGVVRNHHYYVTINSISNLGRGVFNPDEAIVPNPWDEGEDYYYVGANINILSWKIVNQGVDL